MESMEPQQPSSASRGDQLEYMADMIRELGQMARDQKLETLAGILDLAHAETRLRARDAA
jgi:hypothetical protein